MKEKIRFLCLFFKKLKDCYNPKAYTTLSVLVPRPTQSNPLPCILVSLRNGHSKLFFRVENLEAYYRFFELSQETENKLIESIKEANVEADRLESDARLIFQKRHLPEGAKIIQTDTGEVLAEAEKILREATQ